MHLHLRSLLFACITACAALTAAADDYYLRFAKKSINDICQSNNENLREYYKFTQIDNSNVYQLAVEHICNDFFIGNKTGDDILFGIQLENGQDHIILNKAKAEGTYTETTETQDASGEVYADSDAIDFGGEDTDNTDDSKSADSRRRAYKVVDNATSTDVFELFNLVKGGNDYIYNNVNINNDENASYQHVEHLLLTLTIDSNDSDKASLRIEHITNAKLRAGVPSFLFVVTTNAYTSRSYGSEFYQLIRGTGDYDYYVNAGTISNVSAVVVDGPSHSSGNASCMVLEPRAPGTNVTLGYDYTTSPATPVVTDWHNGSDFVAQKTMLNTQNIYKPTSNSVYQVPTHVYQVNGAGGSINFYDFVLYDAKFYFKYDISIAKTLYATEGDIKIPDYDRYSAEDLATAHENLLAHYINQPEYVKTEYRDYNGIFTYEFSLTSTSKFAVTFSDDNFSTVRDMTLVDNLLYLNDNYYVKYTLDVPASVCDDNSSYAFCGAFYVEGYDLDASSTITNVNLYAGDATSSASAVVKDYTYEDESGITSDVLDFYPSHDTNPAKVDKAGKVSASTSSDSAYAVPFFAKSSETIQIVFLYNVKDPSKSLVQVVTSGTLTGVEDIAFDSESAPVEYYNLSGVRVDGSLPGLYIRRQGNSVSKVIVK